MRPLLAETVTKRMKLPTLSLASLPKAAHAMRNKRHLGPTVVLSSRNLAFGVMTDTRIQACCSSDVEKSTIVLFRIRMACAVVPIR